MTRWVLAEAVLGILCLAGAVVSAVSGEMLAAWSFGVATVSLGGMILTERRPS